MSLRCIKLAKFMSYLWKLQVKSYTKDTQKGTWNIKEYYTKLQPEESESKEKGQECYEHFKTLLGCLNQ